MAKTKDIRLINPYNGKKEFSTLEYCPRDYKHHHFWEYRGILETGGFPRFIYQCTQCGHCKTKEIRFIQKGRINDD